MLYCTSTLLKHSCSFQNFFFVNPCLRKDSCIEHKQNISNRFAASLTDCITALRARRAAQIGVRFVETVRARPPSHRRPNVCSAMAPMAVTAKEQKIPSIVVQIYGRSRVPVYIWKRGSQTQRIVAPLLARRNLALQTETVDDGNEHNS